MHYQRPSGSRRTDAAADAAAQPEVDAAAAPGQFLAITGGQQTGQQGSTRIRGNDYFVENIKEELVFLTWARFRPSLAHKDTSLHTM